MATNMEGRDRDQVLAPGEFGFVQDTTKGIVNVNVGPFNKTMAGTDQPVVWDKAKRRFVRCDLEASIQRDLVAPEGFYVALYNPAAGDVHPPTGASSRLIDLQIGHRVNIPGPTSFSLWPGQFSDVIRGHHLHSNQYVLAQVYNDVEATANWKNAVIKPQGDGTDAPPAVVSAKFTPGQLMVIKGTDVAFFIPPTGVKVLPEGDKYVREAMTLERLEYCILLDEDGNKRFVQGPSVVFPEPTETFIVKDSQRKFRAIELNETTGIYVKVIADYDDHKAGDELFITGKEQAIYFQREEHSVIRYGDQTKHYAVAVPSGEGRYVLDRRTGDVKLVRGPKMLLPDPRFEVIILRTLSPATAALWYPNNPGVVRINTERGASAAASGEVASKGMIASNVTTRGLMALNAVEEQARMSRQIVGDTFQRGTTYTPPRTITLDTKYDGAVSVSVWSGYAILIVNKTGKRRVVVGPETVLLEYDETLAPLELSTGRPKTTDDPLRTVYLRVQNNAVSDIVRVETSDLVPLDVEVSYRVNFEGDDKERWFSVENYIGLLCDHMRSLIRNVVKRKGVEEFYGNAIDVIRDAVLGKSTGESARPGRAFSENGMRVYDVEVVNTTINNPTVAKTLSDVQVRSIDSAVKIAEQERGLAVTLRSEAVKRALSAATAETATTVSTNALVEATASLAVNKRRVADEAQIESDRLTKMLENDKHKTELTGEELLRRKAVDDQRLATKTVEFELELKRIVTETEEVVKRAGAIDERLATALTVFADQSLVEKISTALAPMAAMSGVSAADILAQLFKGTPFAGVMQQLGTRSRLPVAELTAGQENKNR